MWDLINPIDVEKFKNTVQSAPEFPHFCLDNFLKMEFAEEVYKSFPKYSDSQIIGRQFEAVNEKRKVQITDSKLFPPPIKKLNDLLAHEEFVEMLSYVFDIESLEPDPELVGGGIHQTDSGGRLDVHVDFNFIQDRRLHRRLNLLLYFNKNWQEEYGGYLDLWDKKVKRRVGYFEPRFNRLCGFVTSNISFHGVTPLHCPEGVVRQSFATYYYTVESPKGWDGKAHSTIFKPRPNELLRGYISMPLEALSRRLSEFPRIVKRKIRDYNSK